MTLCGGTVLQKVLNLSFDRLLMMMMMMIGQEYKSKILLTGFQI